MQSPEKCPACNRRSSWRIQHPLVCASCSEKVPCKKKKCQKCEKDVIRGAKNYGLGDSLAVDATDGKSVRDPKTGKNKTFDRFELWKLR